MYLCGDSFKCIFLQQWCLYRIRRWGVKEPTLGDDHFVNDCAAFSWFSGEGGSAIKMLLVLRVILLNRKIVVGN